MTVEAVTSADPALDYPRFIDGARRAPPEEVGGEPGFDHLLTVMADPGHAEHADLKRSYCGNFDPADISKIKVLTCLATIAKRKPRPMPAATESKRQIN